MFGRHRDKSGNWDNEYGRGRKGHTAEGDSDVSDINETIDDALGSDPARLQEEAGPMGRAFIAAVDTAVHLQTGTIRSYVNWLRRQNPQASPQEIQDTMAKHFRNTVTGTGAGAGAAAAVPGVGLITGSAAIAGESVLFLDLAAFYTVASAYLRGVDVSDPERRRAIVLTTLMGTKGLAIVDAMVGEDAEALPSKNMLSRFSGPGLAQTNNVLTRVAMRSMNKRMRRAWLGKLLPLGLGAAAGTAANRKLANTLLGNVQASLGPVPARFAQPLPAVADAEEEASTAGDADGAKLSLNPREFAAWILKLFSRGGDDAGSRGAASSSKRS